MGKLKKNRADLFRRTEPLEVAFPGDLFFPGFEGENKAVGMVKTDVCRAAPKSLVPDGVLLAVFAFLFFRHGIAV